MLNQSLQLASAAVQTNLGGWFHDLSPFLVRFTPTFGIRYYGLSYALGFTFAYLLLRFLARRNATPIPYERIGDAMMCAWVGRGLDARRLQARTVG